MADSLQKLVRRRAKETCEYCQLPQRYTTRSHEVDHVIATKHRGANHRRESRAGLFRMQSAQVMQHRRSRPKNR